jgi:hypothetical protein
MKRIIFAILFLINIQLTYGDAEWIRRRYISVEPSVKKIELAKPFPSEETLKLQTELAELKAESQNQSDTIDQLRACCLILKKENKLMKAALTDPNFAGYSLYKNNLITSSKQISNLAPLPIETPALQTLIVKLKTQIKTQTLLINHLNITCTKLKEENKLTKKTLAKANLPIPNLFELYEKEQLHITTEKQKEQQRTYLNQTKALVIEPYFTYPLSVGKIAKVGVIESKDSQPDSFKYKQYLVARTIIDSNNAIAEFKINTGASAFKPIPVYDTLVWVKGVDTKGIADDQLLLPEGDYVFKVTGTKSYDTVMGAKKTVFVLEPYEPNLN